MKKPIILIFLIIFAFVEAKSKKNIVCSFHPVSAIVKEISGTAIEVNTIVGNGKSPHTYSLKPTDMIKLDLSDAFIYLGGSVDTWSQKAETKVKFDLLSMLPEENIIFYDDQKNHSHDHDHEHEIDSSEKQIDPHFWLDPIAVKSIIPALKDKLIEIDPDNANIYNANANAFINKIDILNKDIQRTLSSKRGKPVFQFHPSFNYFLKRYKLVNAGIIEVNPGTEITARETAELINKIERSGVDAIFSEPQLSDKAIKMIAKEAGVAIYELDPVGGTKGRERYSDLLLYNATTFKKAL